MIWLLLASLAFAQEEVHAVEDGATAEVVGPAVWMTEFRFRQYVKDSRNLPTCLESLDLAIDEGIASNERTIRAFDVARAQFAADEETISDFTQQILDLGIALDKSEAKRKRAQSQRNVAVAVTAGLLIGAVTVTAISL